MAVKPGFFGKHVQAVSQILPKGMHDFSALQSREPATAFRIRIRFAPQFVSLSHPKRFRFQIPIRLYSGLSAPREGTSALSNEVGQTAPVPFASRTMISLLILALVPGCLEEALKARIGSASYQGHDLRNGTVRSNPPSTARSPFKRYSRWSNIA